MLTDRLIHPELHGLATVQAEHEQELLALPNVVGVALGYKRTNDQVTGSPCVSVLVDMKLSESLLNSAGVIPRAIGPIPTDVVEVGILQAGAGAALMTQPVGNWAETTGHERDILDTGDTGNGSLPALPAREQFAARTPQSFTIGSQFLAAERVRPVMGGASIGHFRGTAGTLGICCHDATTPVLGAPQRFYLLSNNHILANCNEAAIGDAILQPAPADGGRLQTDTIARLTRFVPIKFAIDGAQYAHDLTAAPVNYVDAAVAEGRFDQLDRRIRWIGDLRHGSPLAEIGAAVHKCGRASNYTNGTILAVNATVMVNYPGGRCARFAKQIITNPIATGGDSGAVVATLDQRAVGLLFATSSATAVLNPMPLVEQLLDIRVTHPAAGGRTRTQAAM